MAWGCTHEEVSFVSLDDLHNISILLKETFSMQSVCICVIQAVLFHKSNGVYFNPQPSHPDYSKPLFIICGENSNPIPPIILPPIIQCSRVLKTCTVIRGNFERFQASFLVQQQHGLVSKHNFLNQFRVNTTQ